MKLIAPDYYREFRCIAGDCKHSCCIGWEIDVDTESLARYDAVTGPLGERLQKGIDRTAEPPHFILGEHERCPFLNKEGLCDLIIGLGEDCLCQICSDHPRYRSFFEGRTEIGLGLCCEAAAALILKRPSKTTLVTLEDDGEVEELPAADASLLDWRAVLTDIAQDRSRSVEERAEAILEEAQLPLPDRSFAEWADIYMELERLEESWTDRLTELQQADLTAVPFPEGEAWEIAFEQLLVYFLYRHLPGALEDGDYEGRAAFAVLSYRMIHALCHTHAVLHGAVSIDDLLDVTRQYSAEIEYSDENVEALLDALFEEE